MNHTEEEIKNIVLKLLKDIDRTYLDNSEIFIESNKDIKIPGIKKTLSIGWKIDVPVTDDQFHKDEPAFILVYIDDDSGTIEGYLDCSMGRPVPMKADLNEDSLYELVRAS